jgi:hypothetical protein
MLLLLRRRVEGRRNREQAEARWRTRLSRGAGGRLTRTSGPARGSGCGASGAVRGTGRAGSCLRSRQRRADIGCCSGGRARLARARKRLI